MEPVRVEVLNVPVSSVTTECRSLLHAGHR